jgi:hypothetical protein
VPVIIRSAVAESNPLRTAPDQGQNKNYAAE